MSQPSAAYQKYMQDYKKEQRAKQLMQIAERLTPKPSSNPYAPQDPNDPVIRAQLLPCTKYTFDEDTEETESSRPPISMIADVAQPRHDTQDKNTMHNDDTTQMVPGSKGEQLCTSPVQISRTPRWVVLISGLIAGHKKADIARHFGVDEACVWWVSPHGESCSQAYIQVNTQGHYGKLLRHHNKDLKGKRVQVVKSSVEALSKLQDIQEGHQALAKVKVVHSQRKV